MANPTDLPEPDAAPSTCYGYSARSSFVLSACRPGPGMPLEVVEAERVLDMPEPPLLEWHEEGRPFARLWADAPCFTLWIDGLGWFEIDRRGPSIVVPAESGGIRREARLWGVPAALCFIDRGDLPLHAAAVDVDGSAVVFAAPGRYGKTTLAAAFMQAGHRLLSEDLTCVRTSPTPAVLPGPALLRVRKDVFGRLSFPRADVVAEDETRMYVMPDQVARGSSAAVPLRAIVFLRTHDCDRINIELIDDAGDALRDLWTLSFNLPNDEDRTRSFSAITQLAGAVRIWNLTRPLSYESLPLIIDTIEKLVT